MPGAPNTFPRNTECSFGGTDCMFISSLPTTTMSPHPAYFFFRFGFVCFRAPGSFCCFSHATAPSVFCQSGAR